MVPSNYKSDSLIFPLIVYSIACYKILHVQNPEFVSSVIALPQIGVSTTKCSAVDEHLVVRNTQNVVLLKIKPTMVSTKN